MIVNILILLLFSISLVPENIGFNFTFELRSLIFAIFATILLGFWSLGGNCHKRANSLRQFIFRNKNELISIDIAFIAVTVLTVISFVTKTPNINAFHYAFVQVGMAVVYFFIRTTKKIRTENGPVNFIKEQRTKNQVLISIVGIGFIVAMIGLIQFVIGKPVVSTFGRMSFLGCFLAMNAAVALGTALQLRVTNYELRFKKFNIGFWLTIFAFLVIFGVTILTKSRTALIAMAVVLPIIVLKCESGKVRKWKSWNAKRITGYGLRITSIICALVAVFLLFVGGKYFYKIKPMSASGRVLIWKVSAEMFRKNPVSGVGFGNFANYYNLYQAEYFTSGKGSVINKMTAGQVRHAYNWYLETAVEFGMFGLIVFGIFWWLILVEIFKTFKPQLVPRPKALADKGHKNTKVNYLNVGMSGAVLCFMIMSLFQFPRKIIPTYLLFNFALAWIVNANLVTQKSQETQRKNL